MGRPIPRKFFGVDNVNDGLSYSDAGGEGVASYSVTAGSNYSKGISATVAASPIGGTTATVSSVTTNGSGGITAAAVGVNGTGYTSAPAVTLVKPANVVTTGTSFWPDSSNIAVSTTSGLFVGMTANVGGNKITNIYGDGNVRMSAGANVAGVVSFGDVGTGGAITAVLAPAQTTANTIQANAWTTTGTIGQQADVVSQRSSRRYRVTNTDGTSVCRLVPTGVNGVNSPTVAQVIAAGGPTAAGEMTIIATDSAGGKYLVGKLERRTALLFPAAIGGSAGTQFAANTHAQWTSTGSAVLNTVVKIDSND